jgi:hypothetical protein
MKPHKGTLTNAVRRYPSNPGKDNLGYFYTGGFVNHPRFAGTDGYTSMVVKEDGDEIETLNSRYTLVRKVEDMYRPFSPDGE